MRVLMLSRSDVFSVPGGDTVQMVQTKAGLDKLGVEVEYGAGQETPPISSFDIIHIFNWFALEDLLAAYHLDAVQSPPIVLSTIFWFHTGHWFDQVVVNRPAWKIIQRGVGFSRARRLFEGWQEIKFRRGPKGRKIRKLFSIPVHFLPNSKTELGYLESVLGLKGVLSPHSTIVPNGVTRELFDPMPLPDGAFQKQYGLEGFVIQAGRIQKEKNQLSLIKALFDVPVPIVFAGQPSPYEADYVSACEELAKRRGNVYFLGAVPQETLVGIYRLASVHALPSWRETPGLASLEAAAAGCRVVSTSMGSARDYFGEDAWYCDPRDEDSIRRAVLQALESPPSGKLRQRILDKFTWDVAAKTTLDAYCQVQS